MTNKELTSEEQLINKIDHFIEKHPDFETFEKTVNDCIKAAKEYAAKAVEEDSLTHFVSKLNERLIDPEKDPDLLIEELQEIGVYHSDNGWYIDNE